MKKQIINTKELAKKGIVFTPKKTVNQMLNMLSKEDFGDPNHTFFVPCAGTGNILVEIIKKQLKAFSLSEKNHLNVASITLDNLWSVEINKDFVDESKKRCFNEIFKFLLKHEYPNKTPNINEEKKFVANNTGYLTGIVCQIDWQIQHNEALTALKKTKIEAEKIAKKTKESKKWMEKYGHKPINFDNTWSSCVYYANPSQEKKLMLFFKKRYLLIENIVKHAK